MTFPTGTTISTANLDSATDSPASARSDLLAAVEALNQIIASENSASGVMVLTGSAKIPSTLYGTQITCTTGDQVINPTSGIVNIRDVLRMQPMTTADITALADPVAGDIAYASDGDAGSPCLTFYNGTDWVVISVGSAISST